MFHRIYVTVFIASFGAILASPMAMAQEFPIALQKVADQKIVLATVESVDVVPARTRIGGTIQALSVDEGDRVNAGDVIALVSDPKLTLELVAVDARIESLEAQVKLAELDLQRARKLRKSGAGSQARLDAAQTNVDVVKRSIVAMNAERDVVAHRLDEGSVVAPATGRVLQVKLTQGSVVMPGETVAMLAEETYILRLRLPERHARYIKVGDSVKVGERGLKGGELKNGRVRQVYPELAQGRVVADIDVDGLGTYFVGERVPVFVSTGERKVYLVPPQYLFTRYGLRYVRLKDGTNIVVETGADLNGGIEVLSGVKDGDVIVFPNGDRS